METSISNNYFELLSVFFAKGLAATVVTATSTGQRLFVRDANSAQISWINSSNSEVILCSHLHDAKFWGQ